MRYVPIALVLLLLLTSRAQAQVSLQVWNAPPGPKTAYGAAVAALGDLDGDGLCDVAVCSGEMGDAFVLSGADGSVLLHFPGMGGYVGSAGDIDGDGVPDVLLQATPGPGTNGELVQLRSGVDGSLLLQLGVIWQAYSSTTVSDVNGDGVRDLVIGSPSYSPAPLTAAGRVSLHSGVDGALLDSFAGTQSGEGLGFHVADLGDVDGDGRGDYAFSRHHPGTPSSGSVQVISGASGATLQLLEAGIAASNGVQGAWAVDDLDGDGRSELAVAFYSAETPSLAHLRIHSTADWSVLFTLPGLANQPIRVGDVDGDRAPDLAFVHWTVPGPLQELTVRSGATAQELLDLEVPGLGPTLAPLQDLDADGRVEFAAGHPGFGDSIGRVVLLSLVPARIDALEPDTIAMPGAKPVEVKLSGAGFDFIDSLQMGDMLIDVHDPMVTLVDAGELRFTPPDPPTLGPHPVTVQNEGMPPSNAAPLTITDTHPPVLLTPTVVTTAEPFAWQLYGGANHLGVLLLSASPEIFVVKGWPLLRQYLILALLPLDAVGRANLVVTVPASAAGLAFYSQLATLHGGLVGTSGINLSLVAF